MFSESKAIFCRDSSSINTEFIFFSEANTTQFLPFMPSAVSPLETALSAYSI